MDSAFRQRPSKLSWRISAPSGVRQRHRKKQEHITKVSHGVRNLERINYCFLWAVLFLLPDWAHHAQHKSAGSHATLGEKERKEKKRPRRVEPKAHLCLGQTRPLTYHCCLLVSQELLCCWHIRARHRNLEPRRPGSSGTYSNARRVLGEAKEAWKKVSDRTAPGFTEMRRPWTDSNHDMSNSMLEDHME